MFAETNKQTEKGEGFHFSKKPNKPTTHAVALRGRKEAAWWRAPTLQKGAPCPAPLPLLSPPA